MTAVPTTPRSLRQSLKIAILAIFCYNFYIKLILLI